MYETGRHWKCAVFGSECRSAPRPRRIYERPVARLVFACRERSETAWHLAYVRHRPRMERKRRAVDYRRSVYAAFGIWRGYCFGGGEKENRFASPFAQEAFFWRRGIDPGSKKRVAEILQRYSRFGLPRQRTRYADHGLRRKGFILSGALQFCRGQTLLAVAEPRQQR